jgi:hypothetical protein
MMFGAVQTMALPAMLSMQRGMMEAMEKGIEQEAARQGDAEGAAAAAEMVGFFRTMFELPDWFVKCSVAAGVVALCIAGVYLYAAIGLLRTRLSGITLFYIAASCSIALSLVRAVMASLTSHMMAFALVAGSGFSIVVNAVLLVVVVTGDKQAFRSPPGSGE